jgi:hypothetical protein
MGALYDALVALAPVRDAEILDGYRRYEASVAGVLTPEQLETYAASVQHTQTVRVFEELTPDELAALDPGEHAIAAALMADDYLSMENRRVAALLNQRGQHEVAPDLGSAPDT